MIHDLIIKLYLAAIVRDACPCSLAHRVEHLAVDIAAAAGQVFLYFGNALCRKLDAQVSAADNVCVAGCTGCRGGAS